MSITLSAARVDPDGFEGRVPSPTDRYEVRERIRGTKTVVAVHERFGAKPAADLYAKDRTDHEPHMYGPDAAHELVAVDTDVSWGFRR